MKQKTPRRRVDVNVEELDRIIDDARSAPLSEADSQKLKTALHALAERLRPHAKTEKTNVVLGDAQTPTTEDPQAESPKASGHGRNGADAYPGRREGHRHPCEVIAWRSLPGVRPRQRLCTEGAEGAGADRRPGDAGRNRV